MLVAQEKKMESVVHQVTGVAVAVAVQEQPEQLQ
jgi:hypothetical protein